MGTRFSLLSDPGGAAAQAYGVWDADTKIALAATFLIEKSGRLLYRRIGADKTDRPSIDEVLRAAPAAPAPATPNQDMPAPLKEAPATDEDPPEEDFEVYGEPAEYAEGGSDALIDRVIKLPGAELSVLVPQPAEGKPVVAKLSVAGHAKVLKIGFSSGNYADNVQVVGEELKGFPGKRVAMVQIVLESGEDSFSRSMVTALVFLGDKKRNPKVLWQEEGSYSNYGGECEEIDVISFRPAGTDTAQVVRHLEVIAPEDLDYANGDAADCVAKAKRIKRVARVKIP